MIEIYKEPSDLVARTQHGYILMWLAMSVGGALTYLALYPIVRRASASRLGRVQVLQAFRQLVPYT